MQKRWCLSLAGIALLAAALAAASGRGADRRPGGATAASKQDPQKTCTIELDQIEQQIQAARAEAEAELDAGLVRVDQEVSRLLEEKKAELASGRSALDAQLNQVAEELQTRQADLQERAQDLAAQSKVAVLDMADESGWLGVGIAEVGPEKAKEAKLPSLGGVLVVEVEPNSPAAKAGLQANDIITEYNGQAVEGTVQLRRLVHETPPGRAVRIVVWRDGVSKELSAQLASRREQMESRVHVFGPRDFQFHFDFPASAKPVLGIHAEDLSGQLGAYFQVPGGQGILVEEVNPGSPAEKAGLKAGDVITGIDGQPVKTTLELREKLHEKRDQKSVRLSVIRKGAEQSLTVAIEPPRPAEPSRMARRVLL